MINVATGTTLSYGGIISSNGASSTGGLTKAGAGTLVLSGANTYTGTTTLSAGTLQIGAATAIPSGALKGDLVVNATLDLNANSISINGLSGTTGTITSSTAGAITLTAGGNNKGGIYHGVIQNGSGTLGFTKTGTGLITLGGNNTFSGGVVINAGTLQLGSITGLGATTNSVTFGASAPLNTKLQLNGNSVTIGGLATHATPGSVFVENANASNATLTVNQASDSTFAGVLQDGTGGGALGLTKSGTGVLTLSGNNIFTGTATINAGTLALSGGSTIADATTVSLANTAGAILQLNANETIGTLTGGGTTGGNVNLQSFTLTTGGGTTYAGSIFGAGSLVKSGASTLTLSGGNTFSGTASITAGTLALSGGSAIADTTTVSLANTSGAILQLNASETIGALAGGGTTGGNVNLQSFTLTTGGANSDNAYGGVISGTGSLVKSGTGRLTLSGTNTYTGTTTINAGTLSVDDLAENLGSSATAVALSGGMLSYTGNNAAFTRGLTVSASSGQIETTTAGQTLTLSGGNVAITGTGNFTVSGVGNTAISTNITGTGGGILNKTGTGMLTLSGSNTYSGATNIQNGTLALGVNNGVNQSVAVTLGDATANTNGVLRLNGFSQIVYGLNTAGAGTGNRVTGGSSTLSTLTINAATASSFTGILGGTGTDENNLALTKIGNNTLTLSGNNTYSGNTTVSTGTLKIASVLAIPSGTGKGNVSLTGSLDLNGNSITLNGLSGGGGISSSAAGTMNLAVGGNDQTSSYSGVISNGTATALGLTKIGSGELTLSGASTFTGGTTIKNGSLILSGNNDRLATTGSLILGDTSTTGKLVLGEGTNARNQTLAGLTTTGAGGSVVGSNATTNSLLTLNIAASNTFSGTLGGAGANENMLALSKSGAGTLTLTGTNTYTGTTTVEAGVMTVNGNIGGSVATVVKTGATLNGTGTTGAMDIQSDGTLQPGDGGIGTLTVSGRLTLAGIANFELGTPGASHATPGTSDRVDVTGDVVYGGTINLINNNNAGGLGSAGAGSYKLITYTGTSSGNFTGVTGLPEYHNVFHDVPADKALYIDLYNYAVATVTPEVDLGRIHAGGTFGTQALTVGNSAASGDFTEFLGGVFGTTATGLTSSGSVTGIAGQSNNSNNMIVGISDNTAGQKTGSIGVNFTSQAVSGSGLGNTSLTSQNVTVNGFAYSGQSVWNIAGSGSWGNNVNAYGNWTLAGGVAGLDGILSVNDTATFGAATTAPSTVSLDGANPTLSGIRFDHDQSYTLAQGTGGSLTLKGNGVPAVIANDNGNHMISTPFALASDANVSVAHANDTLTISGAVSGSGNGITKSGDGTLTFTGNSSYTGATLVSAGTLLVNGSLGNTSTTIATGATLAGIGTLGGHVLVNGNIAPGLPTEIGTITVSSMYVDQMMSIDWNGTTNTIDLVNITNDLQLGAQSTIVFNGLDGVLHDSAYVFATYDTFTGPIRNFGNILQIPAGYMIDYAYGAENNQLALVVVPEQGAALLGSLGMLFLLRRRRAGSAA